MQLLLRNGLVLTSGPDGLQPRPVDVLIEDGRIADVRPSSGSRLPGDARVLDASDRLVMPGLINSHTHSWQNIMAGLTDALPLEPWMAIMAAGLVGRTPRESYVSALLGCIQMLKSGVTAVLDHFRTGSVLEAEHVDAVFRAYDESGLRACVGLNLMDRNLAETMPLPDLQVPPDVVRRLETQPSSPVWKELETVEAIVGTWHGQRGGRLTCALAPTGPHRCTDELLLACDRVKRQLGLGLHTHLLESRTEAVMAFRRYGESAVAHLDRLGVLDRRTSLAHSVWLDDDDIDRLARTGASVVHNPASNLKLGDGIAPILRLHRRGVPIALGSDGAGSNDSQQVFEAMKLAALLHRPGADAADWLEARTVLGMATRGGATALFAEGELGAIEPGRRADLVLLRLDSVFLTPHNDLPTQLVLCENGRSVDTVIVDGQVVVRGGVVQTVDERAVLREAEDLRPNIVERTRAAREEAEAWLPFLHEVVRWAQKQPTRAS